MIRPRIVALLGLASGLDYAVQGCRHPALYRMYDPSLHLGDHVTGVAFEPQHALEAAGLEFLEENGAGLGVRFRKPPRAKRN